MPTKHPRLSVTFPDLAFYDMVAKDAALSRRSMSDQIIWIMDEHYAARKREANLFTPVQPPEGRKVPVFETPSQQHAESVSKIRASLDRERS